MKRSILVAIMATIENVFENRMLALRKQKGWSQPELGKAVGTSGAIVGGLRRDHSVLEAAK